MLFVVLINMLYNDGLDTHKWALDTRYWNVSSLGLCLNMAHSFLLLVSMSLLVTDWAVDALPEWKDLECQVLKIFPNIIHENLGPRCGPLFSSISSWMLNSPCPSFFPSFIPPSSHLLPSFLPSFPSCLSCLSCLPSNGPPKAQSLPGFFWTLLE